MKQECADSAERKEMQNWEVAFESLKLEVKIGNGTQQGARELQAARASPKSLPQGLLGSVTAPRSAK